jgi:hypothetical protein
MLNNGGFTCAVRTKLARSFLIDRVDRCRHEELRLAPKRVSVHLFHYPVHVSVGSISTEFSSRFRVGFGLNFGHIFASH